MSDDDITQEIIQVKLDMIQDEELSTSFKHTFKRKMTVNDIFVCTPLTPFTENVLDKYLITYHLFTNNHVCDVCGTDLTSMEEL